jgi:proline-specific peptidase
MSSPSFIEGEVVFSIPAADRPCKTYYKVYGDLSKGRPLVGLHGGPGISHEYLTPLTDLTSTHSIPLVLYDQVGTGLSTHLPEKKGDVAFWSIDLFVAELDNLLTHLGITDNYDLLGHSWGGILGASFAVRQPAGLKRLILADSLPDMNLWLKAQWAHRERLPKETQDVLAKHEAAGTTSDAEYQGATMGYITTCMCRLVPMPAEIVAGFMWIGKDPTVSSTMCVSDVSKFVPRSYSTDYRYGPNQVLPQYSFDF